MKISTRGRYGLRAMVDLACNSREKPISIQNIAERQNVSCKYLEQIFPSLKRAGLVKSVRGSRGGYILGREPESITVGDVLRALEGSLAPVECIDNDPDFCNRSSFCVTRKVWEEVKSNIEATVDRITIKDLMQDMIMQDMI